MSRRNHKNRGGITDQLLNYQFFLDQLKLIAISSFSWHNLPESMTEYFIEKTLLYENSGIFFQDDVTGEYKFMRCIAAAPFNDLDEPIRRRAYSNNGFSMELSDGDSIIMYDNYLHTNTLKYLMLFATKLKNIELAREININTQKMPFIIACSKEDQLSAENLYLKIEDGQPAIFVSKNFDLDNVKILNVNAPVVFPELHDELIKVMRQAFAFLGVGALEINKKERLITKEMQANEDANVALRSGRLKARIEAAGRFNRMFNLSGDQAIWVEYNPEVDMLVESFLDMVGIAKEELKREDGASNESVHNTAPISD